MSTFAQPRQISILLAEDDPDDRMLATDALAESHLLGGLRFVEDGEELMDYLHRRGNHADPSSSPWPELILLDLNMPRKDGREALQEIKADPELRSIPVVVLTTSDAEEDVRQMYELGASSYITKPESFGSLLSMMGTVGSYWAEVVELPRTTA